MSNPRKPSSGFHLALSVLVIAGLFFWTVSAPGFTEVFVLDEQPKSSEKLEAKELKDRSHPYWLSSADRHKGAPFFHLARMVFLLAFGIFLVAAIFRLKLVLVTPHIGPPLTF